MTIEEFPLAWRWTQPSHRVFPREVLSRMHPLTAELANSVYHELAVSDAGPGIKVSAAGSPYKVRGWLRKVWPDATTTIYVSWTKELAIKTDWDVFTEYWDDFCYPASDDVAVMPLAGGWQLYYRHGMTQGGFLPMHAGH